MSDRILERHIEITPGVAGGKPCIVGHRIKVRDVVIWHERKGYIHKSFRVTVEPGENVLPLIAVPIREFAAP